MVGSEVVEYGRLETEPTAVVCRRLGEESRTGCLRLRQDGAAPEDDVRIYLLDGRVYTATAPSGRARLGDRLVGGGHISTEMLAEALAEQARRHGGVRLGDVLVEQGMVSRELLREVIRDQICDSVALALARQSGQWRFVDGEQVTEDVPLGLNMQDTLLEGARRLGELEVIRTQLGSLDAVVDFRAGTTDVRVSLKADEWEMLTHIDGRNTITEVAARSGYSLLETARIVYGLLSAGVLRVVGTAAPLPIEGRPTERPADALVDPDVADLLGELDALAPSRPQVLPPPPPAGGTRPGSGWADRGAPTDAGRTPGRDPA